MEATRKLNKNWKKTLWISIDEQDVMQLRSKLKNIRKSAENALQSYNMNCADNVNNRM